MPNVQTRHLDIGYVEIGPTGGQPVVLLHGWPNDVRCWDGIAPLSRARRRSVREAVERMLDR